MKEKWKRAGLLSIFVLCALLLLSSPVMAASKKYQNKWYVKNGNVYYYDSKGKKVTGVKKIKNKYYYFDSKGIQRTGWQLIKGNYYFYNIGTGLGGYRVTSKTIDGIKLAKTGKASKTSANLRKLKIMVEANRIMQSLTNAKMPKKQKLQKCFDYIVGKVRNYRTFRSFSAFAGWDMTYAEDVFFRGGGNCFSFGAAFAYLANAVGYSNVKVISSGGHGWAEVNGKVYDPDWATVSKVDTYFAMSYDLSGVAGRPNYRPNRTYIVSL